MYDEDELLPISALQHLLFCERQCALEPFLPQFSRKIEIPVQLTGLPN